MQTVLASFELPPGFAVASLSQVWSPASLVPIALVFNVVAFFVQAFGAVFSDTVVILPALPHSYP